MSLGTVIIIDELDGSSGGPKHVRITVVGDGAYPAGGSVGLNNALAAVAKDGREVFDARAAGPNGDAVLEYTPLGFPREITVVPSTDLFSTADGFAHGLVAGDALYFYGRATANTNVPATLAGGLLALTPYYVIASGLTSTAFKVSATVGGAAVDITTVPTAKLLFRKADKLLVRVMSTGVESAVADQSATTYKMIALCR